MEVAELILRAATEAQSLVDRSYAAGEPEAGSALDQAGLRDGLVIVQDYLRHGEAGLAFEHLAYMVNELTLSLSEACREDMRLAAERLGLTRLIE
jgi:hypothetical protein